MIKKIKFDLLKITLQTDLKKREFTIVISEIHRKLGPAIIRSNLQNYGMKKAKRNVVLPGLYVWVSTGRDKSI